METLEAAQHTVHTLNAGQARADQDRRAAQRQLRASDALVQVYALRLSRQAHAQARHASRSAGRDADGAGSARQTDHRPASVEHPSPPARNARPHRDRAAGGRSRGRDDTRLRGTAVTAPFTAATATA